MNVLLTGGGTGGHVYPALALAEALRRQDPGCRLLFAGSRAGMEAALVPAAGIPFAGLAVRPPRSRAPLRALVSLASVGMSLGQAAMVVARFRPSVIVATGGIAALPVVMAGAVFAAPVVVLEGNAVPGRANRALIRFSRCVAVGSDAAAAGIPAGRAAVTGLPIRREVYSGSRAEGISAFGLDPNRRTVLIIGGSQGAARLNQAAVDALALLAHRGDVQVLHQVGRGWSGSGDAGPAPVPTGAVGYVRVPYLEHVGLAYACADVVVSRCGANALAEITACGLPSILVPYPHAAEDHQAHNAVPLVAAGAAVLLPDARLTGQTLAGEIAGLLDAPERLRAMAERARSQGRPDATEQVVALIVQLAHPAPEEVRG